MRGARQTEDIADGLEPSEVGLDIAASLIDNGPAFGILVEPYSYSVFRTFKESINSWKVRKPTSPRV